MNVCNKVWLQEVQRLLDEGVSHQRLEALGLEYRYVSRWLLGAFESEDEMVQRLKFAIHDFTQEATHLVPQRKANCMDEWRRLGAGREFGEGLSLFISLIGRCERDNEKRGLIDGIKPLFSLL